MKFYKHRNGNLDLATHTHTHTHTPVAFLLTRFSNTPLEILFFNNIVAACLIDFLYTSITVPDLVISQCSKAIEWSQNTSFVDLLINIYSSSFITWSNYEHIFQALYFLVDEVNHKTTHDSILKLFTNNGFQECYHVDVNELESSHIPPLVLVWHVLLDPLQLLP